MFDLIFQHPDFVVINKHPEISVHKDQQEHGLVETVSAVLGLPNLYLVHRLDKMTSGLLILATQAQAAAELAQCFAKREIDKFYLAISAHKPKKKQGLICGDMEKSRRSAWKLMKSQQNPAVTQFFSLSLEQGRRAFLCKPYTGKTHQIRVALKSLSAPILGDGIYTGATDSDRGYLHAYAICFVYQGQRFEFRCDPRTQSQGVYWQSPTLERHLNQGDWQSPWLLNWPTLPGRLTR
ncbi:MULTISPECIES: TIGR01621 family pseudouridine synthase [unclassified Vibrio]|uniref:TIGR01621 family pseudouridine synthase n=1 Tax=Vibrio sp. HB236076 TaxID=3232307 RepID=A0AB39HDG5_9VIBR|nr:TIGR01621 family pseudouridine synthase [Vibrio sp. HB161653]MDP5253612.1 TIGR01621 family pseudouridine synthase [Vibrio sp. HB161653]